VTASAPVLLVTGGSRGIGAATAQFAAERGYDVAVNYLRDADAAAAVVKDIEAAGRRAIALQGDMAREDDIERVFSAIDERLGPLTHLVYNSGMTGPQSRLQDATTETFRAVLDVNVLGALIAARMAVRRMARGRGPYGRSIVFLSSAAATLGAPDEYVWYAASKGAIESLTVGLARELATEGIRVNAVAPGPIETDIHAPGRLERITPQVPMGRAGTAEEVAEAILFLLSDAASFITGTVLRVAGGR
jgi:NAD(P)-dependent dehydrogenase (short-subunit alcohol dehydrogenase family)